MSIRKYVYYLTSIFTLLTGIREWPLVIRIFLHLPAPARPTLQLKNGLRFQVRRPMDVWSVKETLLDEFYKKFGVAIGDDWTIVDIGAGIGEFTLYAAYNHPRNRVYAFEPFPDSFDLLQTNLELNGVKNVQACREAIGAQSGTLLLDLSNGEPLQFSTEQTASAAQTISVPALSLAEAFQRLDIEHCHLLKLDCEGAEYAILFNAPDAVFERIEHIVMEYHDGVTQYTHADLVEFLRRKGFQVKTYANYVHPYLGYLHAWK